MLVKQVCEKLHIWLLEISRTKDIDSSICFYVGQGILEMNCAFVFDIRLRNKKRKSRRLAEPRDACNTTEDLELSSPHSAAERDPMLTPKQFDTYKFIENLIKSCCNCIVFISGTEIILWQWGYFDLGYLKQVLMLSSSFPIKMYFQKWVNVLWKWIIDSLRLQVTTSDIYCYKNWHSDETEQY